MICEKCGNETPDGFVFCRVCGAKLDYSKKNNHNTNKNKKILKYALIMIILAAFASIALVLKFQSDEKRNIVKVQSESIEASLMQIKIDEERRMIASFSTISEIKNNINIVNNATNNNNTIVQIAKDRILSDIYNFSTRSNTSSIQSITNNNTNIHTPNTTHSNTDNTKVIDSATLRTNFGTSDFRVGNYVQFGSYAQSTHDYNSKEKIRWKILDIKDGKALLIAEKGLDCKQYNSTLTPVNWSNSSLRNWLNTTFYKNAFNKNERELIVRSRIGTSKNKTTGISSGKASNDYVFIPSEGEVNTYLGSENNSKCKASSYAIWQGAWASVDSSVYSNGFYWLRNQGIDNYTSMVVDAYGRKSPMGVTILATNVLVRPEIWVSIE
ncbi:MAG: DUF6273 domain-containing protein [Eubacteriales bacterium]|nr:DUF6273 domain-containing protein [Eubacteriales bacterium]